jgi:CRISPR/Cas system CSM-associated protein Csm2 small subunit
MKRGYSLDMVYILKLIEEEADLTSLYEESERASNIHTTMVRKALITNDDRITTIGKDLIEFISSTKRGRIEKKKSDIEGFEEWWKTYPGTDTFEYKGKKFIGSRSLRQNKDMCRIKFEKIMIEGDYTAQQLIEALKYEILQKKEASSKTSVNKLAYMQNSLTYLNQRTFEPFMELLDKKIEVEDNDEYKSFEA